ncbi:hypothetical protein ABTZ99_34095 [Actinosynnema sp. NPDC002837]
MTSTLPRPLLIDQLAPRPDFTRSAHVVVEADPVATYDALRELDFSDLHGPVLDAMTWARRLPNLLKGRPTWHARMTLDDIPADSGWVRLAELPGTEIVFGAIGTFWRPFVHVRDLEARDFPDFVRPGYGKVVCSLSVVPYGQRRTLLTYDTRTTATDPRSWARLRRYWHLAGPFVTLLEHAVLRSIKEHAERGGTR